jgi:hypothetical protein
MNFLSQTKKVFLLKLIQFPGKDTKLVLVPNPMRVILNVGVNQQQIVWTAK